MLLNYRFNHCFVRDNGKHEKDKRGEERHTNVFLSVPVVVAEKNSIFLFISLPLQLNVISLPSLFLMYRVFPPYHCMTFFFHPNATFYILCYLAIFSADWTKFPLPGICYTQFVWVNALIYCFPLLSAALPQHPDTHTSKQHGKKERKQIIYSLHIAYIFVYNPKTHKQRGAWLCASLRCYNIWHKKFCLQHEQPFAQN